VEVIEYRDERELEGNSSEIASPPFARSREVFPVIEQELKYRLRDLDEFERLIAALGGPEATAEQLNHYFVGDAGGVLERGEAMLRLRLTRDSAALAFKSGLVRDGALFRCEEVEAPVARELGEAMEAGKADPLALDHPASREALRVLGSGPLRVAGASRTLRSRIRLESGEILEADRCSFPGGFEDFEIELETDDPATSASFLRREAGFHGIVLRPQEKTKYRRFLEGAGYCKD